MCRDVTGQSTLTGDTSILTITSVRSSSYVCTVWSGSLSVMSKTASLTVYGMFRVCVALVSLCVLLENIISAPVLYARIVLVRFKRVLRGYYHLEPLPTSVGRTLYAMYFC